MGPVKEPYGFDPDFEKVVLYFLASQPRFWSVCGYALDPDCFEHPLAKLIVGATRQIGKELGHGPDSNLLVAQRLRRLAHEGKVTLAELEAVGALLDEVEEFNLPALDSVTAELLPILKRRLNGQAIALAHDAWGKPGADFGVVAAQFEKASRLGKIEMIAGTRLGPAGFDEIEKLQSAQRLPTGILELDIQLNQGLARRQLGVWVGDSGAGKSMALAHVAAEGTRRQLFVGFATLELPEAVQLARLYANLSGIMWNSIMDSDRDRIEARRRIDAMMPYLGICEVAEFAPHATSVRDLDEWVDQKQQHHGVQMDLLVVDYADKLAAPQVKDGNEYTAMRYVYEGLRRDIAMARDMWVWTASQASRPSKESAKRVDLHHIADSMHKVRVADVVITINPRDEQNEFFVAKNRMGRSRMTIGPIPNDFERARLVPIVAEFQKW
jgi:KaiC/GvpD/RAD55 family RecA-like ATPase